MTLGMQALPCSTGLQGEQRAAACCNALRLCASRKEKSMLDILQRKNFKGGQVMLRTRQEILFCLFLIIQVKYFRCHQLLAGATYIPDIATGAATSAK